MQQQIGEWLSQQATALDPFIESGGSLRYVAQHPFVIHIQEKPEVMQVLKEHQLLRVKVSGDEENKARTIRMELTSDSEIYFNFHCECTEWEFKRTKAQQGLLIQFKQYSELIIKNFMKLAFDQYVGIFTIFSETEGKLSIIKKSQFKDTVVIEFQFVRAPEEMIKKSIQHRYNLMLRNYQLFSKKYEAVCEVVRAKNPSLLMQIQKILKKKA